MSSLVTRVFDCEVYPNFFLALFMDVATKEIRRFQISPNRSLDRRGLLQTLQDGLLVGFNSAAYDLPMIQCALKGYSTWELKDASDDIIVRNEGIKDFAKAHDLSKPSWNHIDLIQVAPLKGSLKLYAGRLHCQKLQDLPIDPNKEITAEEAAILVEYCGNDLVNTATLYEELDAQVRLREDLSRTYKQDLRSRSDAQVAEHVISAEVEKINGVRPKRPEIAPGQVFKYKVPGYLNYRLPQLQKLLETVRTADFAVSEKGSIVLPPALAGLDIRIGGGKYRIGIGGLHSSETSVCHVADDDVLLIDRDVASYYPRIILTQGLYPQHLGPAFLTVYQALVDRRLAAKNRAKEITGQLKGVMEVNQLKAELALALVKVTTEAESLKISINGSFGKLGNKWSALYSPDLLIQVTMTGQLALLLLIERIEEFGIRVVSANTDGVLIRCRKWRHEKLNEIIAQWEKETQFETEETRYSAVFSKDVNNYLAIKTDGKVKGKGLYANPWEVQVANIFKLHKNPSTTIVIEAIVGLLRDGVPLERTIKDCTDIRKFIAVRAVTGGASSKGEYVGKVVRWFYSTDPNKSVMNYQKSGYKVPKSDGSKPLMDLPEALPTDINYAWYVAEAQAALNNIGYGQQTLFGS